VQQFRFDLAVTGLMTVTASSIPGYGIFKPDLFSILWWLPVVSRIFALLIGDGPARVHDKQVSGRLRSRSNSISR